MNKIGRIKSGIKISGTKSGGDTSSAKGHGGIKKAEEKFTEQKSGTKMIGTKCGRDTSSAKGHRRTKK